jgi:hypothetical protein
MQSAPIAACNQWNQDNSIKTLRCLILIGQFWCIDRILTASSRLLWIHFHFRDVVLKKKMHIVLCKTMCFFLSRIASSSTIWRGFWFSQKMPPHGDIDIHIYFIWNFFLISINKKDKEITILSRQIAAS